MPELAKRLSDQFEALLTQELKISPLQAEIENKPVNKHHFKIDLTQLLSKASQ